MDLNQLGNAGVYREKSAAQDDVRKRNGSATQNDPEKHPSCARNLGFYLTEYCERSSIAGLSFLGERGRTIPERICWLIVILVALYFSVTQIFLAYQKWVNSPVIVTFATTQTPIWKIPFPAVTVCPDVKSRKIRFNYTELFLKKENEIQLTPEEEMEFEYISQVCNTDASLLNQSMTTSDLKVIDFLSEVAPDFHELMFEVRWRGRRYKGKELEDLFAPILTTEGICYTFNLMDRSEVLTDAVTHYRNFFSTNGKHSAWSLESGYAEGSGADAYPKRTVIHGVKGGLGMTFFASRDDLDYACGDSLQGFKITLHHPAEIPRVKQKYFRVPLDQSVVAAIKPNMMTTSGELETYRPEDRQCFFTRERNLKLFKIYNQQNCLVECLTDYTLQTCGCVGFHMNRNNSIPICGSIKKQCMEDAKASFLASEVESKIARSDKKPKPTEKNKPKTTSQPSASETCNCLPSCNSLDFEVETSQSDWEWKEYLEVQRHTAKWNRERDTNKLNGSHFARVALFFKEMQFITSERNELYGATDFWANCGGLMGLFTGFSFMSVFEILYFLTLRVTCNIQKFGRHYWSGAEELVKAKEKSSENKVNDSYVN